MIVHVRSIYHADGFERDELERDCDLLMETLLDFEEHDPAVRDASVSADLGKNHVQIEVDAQADSYDEAAKLARERIDLVIGRVTGQAPIYLHERHSELVDA